VAADGNRRPSVAPRGPSPKKNADPLTTALEKKSSGSRIRRSNEIATIQRRPQKQTTTNESTKTIGAFSREANQSPNIKPIVEGLEEI